MTTTNNTAATILSQLGRVTLAMLGAKNLLDTGDGLQFKIGKNPKKATHVTITLAADDTYTVKVSKVPTTRAMMKGAATRTLAELDGVYADSLHRVIETETGLCTKL